MSDVVRDTFEPSLGITVTASVREGVRLIMFGVPCPTCGERPRQRLTLRDVATETGASAATLSRFLNGRGIDSDTLDRLYEWVNRRLPGVPLEAPKEPSRG